MYHKEKMYYYTLWHFVIIMMVNTQLYLLVGLRSVLKETEWLIRNRKKKENRN